MTSHLIAIVCLSIFLAGCSGPQPILYPNPHFQQVGSDQAEHDIGECRERAELAGATPEAGKGQKVAGNTVLGGGLGAATGAVGGAVVGAAGRGAAVGAAAGAASGLIRGLLASPEPSQAYKTFVNTCFQERGYDSVGWD